MTVSNDLSKFGARQLKIAGNLLSLYAEKEENDDFKGDKVEIVMSMTDGKVFLTNSEYQILQINGDRLERIYYSPVNGRSGFLDEFIEDYDSLLKPDKIWLEEICSERGIDLNER